MYNVIFLESESESERAAIREYLATIYLFHYYLMFGASPRIVPVYK